MKTDLTFIAEIGLNHNGNFNLAYELIRQAKYAGADIAKFQLGWRAKAGEMNCIDKDIMEILMRSADHIGINLMFSVFTEEAYDFLKPYGMAAYKIASRTVIDAPDLCKRIVDEGKPVYLSLGMWNESSLPFSESGNVRYLWCKSRYPTHPWDLEGFPKDFTGSPYCGYSDHSVGIDTALLALARGARVIEKHFTLDKSDVTIRDHALSATPSEFSDLTRIGREMVKKLEMGI